MGTGIGLYGKFSDAYTIAGQLCNLQDRKFTYFLAIISTSIMWTFTIAILASFRRHTLELVSSIIYKTGNLLTFLQSFPQVLRGHLQWPFWQVFGGIHYS
jgi:hypothetical protein